jgi:hypothetical protein
MSFIWGNDERLLTPAEEKLIKQAFRTTRLPSMYRIRIRNGLSVTGTPITTPRDGQMRIVGPKPEREFLIMVGQRLFNGDVAVSEPSTLVHETTHVWQYFHHTLTEAHGAVAHIAYGAVGKTNSLYKYNLGQSWNSMGFEGQAQLVEDWYSTYNMSETDDRWYYVLNVLMLGDVAARSQSLNELKSKTPTYQPENLTPDRHISSEDVPFTEDYILTLLNQNIRPSEIPKLAGRIKDLDEYFRQFRKFRLNEATALATRFEQNKPGDKLAQAFHYRLSTPSRHRLIMVLRGLG